MIWHYVCSQSDVTVIIPTQSVIDVSQILLDKLTHENWNTIVVSDGGFVENCNRGLEEVTTKYVLYLNDDVIPATDSIGRMYDYLETHPLVAVVGGALYSPEGKPLTSCGRYASLVNAVAEFLHLTRVFKSLHRGHIPFHHARDVDYVTGAALMARRTLDGFDSIFEAYCEDMEYCRRVKSMRVVHLPAAKFIHVESQSYGPRKKDLILESTEKYLRKYHSVFYTEACMWLYRNRVNL